MGFTEEMQTSPVGSLSGGWKMKLALGEPPLLPQYIAAPAIWCTVLYCRVACTASAATDTPLVPM